MAHLPKQSAPGETGYTITVQGGREYGSFEIVPPVSDEHHAIIMEEPRLSRPSDFGLERGAEKDTFWLGHEFNNGSGYGEHYERTKYFARVVADVLRRNRVAVFVAIDKRFEARTEHRLREIQQSNIPN